MYAVAASSSVRRWARRDDLAVPIRRRSSASACVRVSPSARASATLEPEAALDARPPTRQEPY